MVVASALVVQITKDAEDFIAEQRLQEPFQRMLDEIPKRFPGVQAVTVAMEYIVDENNRPCVTINVPRPLPVERADPLLREWARWGMDAFAPDVLELLGVMPLYQDPHAG